MLCVVSCCLSLDAAAVHCIKLSKLNQKVLRDIIQLTHEQFFIVISGVSPEFVPRFLFLCCATLLSASAHISCPIHHSQPQPTIVRYQIERPTVAIDKINRYFYDGSIVCDYLFILRNIIPPIVVEIQEGIQSFPSSFDFLHPGIALLSLASSWCSCALSLKHDSLLLLKVKLWPFFCFSFKNYFYSFQLLFPLTIYSII